MRRHIPFLPPVWLHQHLVDLFEPDDLFAVTDGLQQGRDAEIAHLAQNTFGGPYDQIECVVAEGVVPEPDAIELLENEGFDVVGIETVEVDITSPILLHSHHESAHSDRF